MFPPLTEDHFGINHTVFTNSTINEDAPFDLKWLAEHFKFDCSDVKKAEFASFDLMFEIHFKTGKESIAKAFFHNLTEKGCAPQHFEFINSACIITYLYF